MKENSENKVSIKVRHDQRDEILEMRNESNHYGVVGDALQALK